MRQVSPLLAVGAVAIIAAVLGRGGPSSLARQEEASPHTPMLPAPSSTTFQYQGVASCASVACHHGNGPSGTKGSEYTTWIAQHDPHSRAYTVLFDKRSLLIEKNLNGPKTRPHENKLCLSCHVNPETANRHERFSLADGVGCESCHGAAERWLSVHYTIPWKNKSAQEKQRDGMTNTKDVAARAQVCVRCHVGWEGADVNHDLIAAGHPRLRFEYGAYLANYPARHWKIADDHGRYGDFEARAWLLGQVASAEAALELLSYRADPKHGQPWPEFAEYGCFSCHHELQDQAWRRKRDAAQLAWGTWYFAQLETAVGTMRPFRIADDESLSKLSRMMAKNIPEQGRQEVSMKAAKAAKVLDRWMSELAKREVWDEKSLEKLLATLTKEDRSEEIDWDRAAQRYLGIAAVFNALGDIDGTYCRDMGLKTSLHRMADLLSNDAFRTPQGTKYDSPRKFDPDRLRQDMKQLREQLQRRGVK